ARSAVEPLDLESDLGQLPELGIVEAGLILEGRWDRLGAGGRAPPRLWTDVPVADPARGPVQGGASPRGLPPDRTFPQAPRRGPPPARRACAGPRGRADRG